jgi:D-threo-aldose 1-dehydrogenase
MRCARESAEPDIRPTRSLAAGASLVAVARDTARIYGMGRSETRVGALLRDRGGLPPGFVLSTKIDRHPETGVFDAAQAPRSLDTSLKTLGLERLDLL